MSVQIYVSWVKIYHVGKGAQRYGKPSDNKYNKYIACAKHKMHDDTFNTYRYPSTNVGVIQNTANLIPWITG